MLMPTCSSRFSSLASFVAVLCAMAIALVQPAAAQSGSTQSGTIDPAWFYPNRPAGLVALEGNPAPEIATSEWIGDETSLAGQRGNVVVLDFWGTWCPPCVRSIPKNIEMVNKYASQGFTFIGMHTENGWNRAPGMVQSMGINYPCPKDAAGGTTARTYNVGFYPTYVVIDRKGDVRATGVQPQYVENIVKILLAEPRPAGLGNTTAAASSGEFDAGWYVGGAERPAGWAQAEGQPAPAMKAAAWHGTKDNEAPDADAAVGRVQVVQFVRPEVRTSLFAARALNTTAKNYTRQGVVFTAVCDAGSDWDAMVAAHKQYGLVMPVAHDTEVVAGDDEEGADARAEARRLLIDAMQGGGEGEISTVSHSSDSNSDGGDDDSDTEAREAGTIAKAFGVRFAPVTAVVDRNGKIRAVGLKGNKLKQVIDLLLAEPYVPAETEEDAEGGDDEAEAEEESERIEF